MESSLIALVIFQAIRNILAEVEIQDCPLKDISMSKNVNSSCKCLHDVIICEGWNEIPRFSRTHRLWKGLFLQNQNISSIRSTAFFNLRTLRIDLSNNPLGGGIHRHGLIGKRPFRNMTISFVYI